MKVLIDHTGLHAVGNCLSRSAIHEDQILGLMQFAILLIFGDHLSISGFEHEKVLRETKAVINSLVQIGIPADLIEVTEISEKEYANACFTAASLCVQDLKWAYDISKLGAFFVEEGQADIAMRENAFLVNAYTTLAKDEGIQFYSSPILGESGARGPIHMMALSRRLRQILRPIVLSDTITNSDIFRLNAILRYYLNVSLAGEHQTYVPAVGRAKVLRQSNAFLIQQVLIQTTSDMHDLKSQLEPDNLLTSTSIAKRLIVESKGSPKGVIEAAINLRERTADLRNWLTELSESIDLNKPEGRKKAALEIQGFIKALNLEGTTSIFDTIQVGLPIGLTVTPADIAKWILASQKQKKAKMLLTEISKVDEYPIVHSEDFYSLLSKNCFRFSAG